MLFLIPDFLVLYIFGVNEGVHRHHIVVTYNIGPFIFWSQVVILSGHIEETGINSELSFLAVLLFL